MENLDFKVKHVQKILKTNLLPVGVKIIQNTIQEWDDSFKGVEKDKRFCYYVLRAARGEKYVITEDSDLDCYTPFLCLGFKEPKYVDVQPRINPAITKAVLIGPLNEFTTPIDTIIFIVNPKQGMLLTSALFSFLKKKINATFGSTMAVCGEIVAYTFENKTPNISLLCGGARIFSGYDDTELIFGVPFHMFDQLYEALKKLEELQALELKIKR